VSAFSGGGPPVRRVERVDGGQLGPGDWPAFAACLGPVAHYRRFLEARSGT